MSKLLEYRSASVGYSGKTVLEGVSFEVAPGELVGLVGPNGAGKSTLVKAVTGEAEVHGGSIELLGRPLNAFSAAERARTVGVVPQQVIVSFSFPSVEFVEMGRHPHLPRFGRPGIADTDAVERAMRLTDTTHLAEQPVDALSGGDLQRLALAQALAQEPSLLLLDEPTSHLDLNHRLQVLDLVRDLVRGGMGALAVFHDLDLAARYADRIAVVSGGRIAQPARPEVAITAPMLKDVFGVRAVVGTDPVTGTVSVTPVLREGAVSSRPRGRVLVVGGSGVAAPLMRRLVLDGWSVSSGALNAGDADAIVAEALGASFARIAPFAPMDERSAEQVTALAQKADVIVVCEVPFGHGNLGNLEAALKAERPLVLVGEIAGRDFTGGRAEELWQQALAAGARVALSIDEVEHILDELGR